MQDCSWEPSENLPEDLRYSVVLFDILKERTTYKTLYCSYILLFWFKLIFSAYFAYHRFRGYENPPKPSDMKLQEAGHHFATGILTALKCMCCIQKIIFADLKVYLITGGTT